MQDLLDQEAFIKFISFVMMFLLMATLEIKSPKRASQLDKSYRWANNMSISLLNSVILRMIFPSAAAGVAIWVDIEHFGLFNSSFMLAWAPWLKAIAGLILLDFAIWLQHLLFHFVPALWRLHRVHHSDLDIDFTSGLRFHPLEIVLSMAFKSCIILMFGVPVAAVLIFEICLSSASMFNHGNIHIPARVDKLLRWFIVTPDMHIIHHSWSLHETNSNFGFNFPWWDRLLGTYKSAPDYGYSGMTIGLHEFRTKKDARVDKLLLQPFARASRRNRT